MNMPADEHPNAGNTHAPDEENKRIGPVFKYGLAAGFALILIGGTALSLSLTNLFLEILVVCAGLGVIFGAFGSTASISIPVQGITLTGVAAIVVALFIILIGQLDNRYVLVRVNGDIQEADVSLAGDHDYFGAFRKALKSHDFIIFGKEIKARKLHVTVTMKDRTEYPFDCIDAAVIRPYLASGMTIEWSFKRPTDDNDTPKILDSDGQPVANDIGGCRHDILRASTTDAETKRSGYVPGLISVAYAQASGALSDEEIGKLIGQLESDISRLRRGARSDLAAAGPVIVQPLLARLNQENSSYRLRLGVVVALAEMLRDNKDKRALVIGKIEGDALERLVEAAADKDRTIRIYASEFLYDLGDPRSIPMAFNQFRTASPNGRFNVLLPVKGAVPFATAAEKTNVITTIVPLKTGSPPKVGALIDSIVVEAKKN